MHVHEAWKERRAAEVEALDVLEDVLLEKTLTRAEGGDLAVPDEDGAILDGRRGDRDDPFGGDEQLGGHGVMVREPATAGKESPQKKTDERQPVVVAPRSLFPPERPSEPLEN